MFIVTKIFSCHATTDIYIIGVSPKQCIQYWQLMVTLKQSFIVNVTKTFSCHATTDIYILGVSPTRIAVENSVP